MPQAIGAAIGGAVAFLASGTVAAFFVNAALLIGTSLVLNRLAQPKIGSVAPREVIVRSGSQPKIVVYGESVVAGVLMYMNQKPISGDENYELWIALAHCAHEVEAMDDFYYENDVLRSGVELSWSSNQSDVNSGPWHADDATHEASRIYRRLGTTTQTLPTDYINAFADITSDHQARGYACSFHRFQIFDESEETFKGGQPQNIRAKIKGKKNVYDPRLDATPGADPDNASFQAWTDNPVLIAVDYHRRYMGLPNDRFDWADVVTQADKCDVTVSTPAGNQKRFTCNGALSLGDTHDANVGKILATCLGQRITVNGKVRIRVGDDQAASVTLDETDIIGAVTVRTAVARAERYNKVVGTYLAADQNYTETEFLPVENAGFVTRDNGEELTKELSLEMVHNEYLAQRIAFKHLQQSDQQLVAEVPLRWSGLRLTPGTYVTVTYAKFNWSSKLFRCESLKIGDDQIPVTAILREDSASAWDDPTVGQYTTRTFAGVITKPATPVPPPTSMTATAVPGGVQVKWLNPARESFDFVRVYASSSSAWAGASEVGVVNGSEFLHKLDPKVQRWYWVRAVRNGVESLREPNSDTSDRTAISPVLDAPINLLPAEFSDFDGPHILADLSVVTGGGTWTRQSGSPSIAFTGTYVMALSQAVTNVATNVLRLTREAEPNLAFPKSARIIVAVHIYPLTSHAASANARYSVRLYTPTERLSGFVLGSALTQNAWNQARFEIDLGAASNVDTKGYIELYAEETTDAGQLNVRFDAVMVFDATELTDIQPGADPAP